MSDVVQLAGTLELFTWIIEDLLSKLLLLSEAAFERLGKTWDNVRLWTYNCYLHVYRKANKDKSPMTNECRIGGGIRLWAVALCKHIFSKRYGGWLATVANL